MKWNDTYLDCSCGNRLGGTHISGGYVFTCGVCGKTFRKGFRAFVQRLFGSNMYMFLLTGRWPRYEKEKMDEALMSEIISRLQKRIAELK